MDPLQAAALTVAVIIGASAVVLALVRVYAAIVRALHGPDWYTRQYADQYRAPVEDDTAARLAELRALTDSYRQAATAEAERIAPALTHASGHQWRASGPYVNLAPKARNCKYCLQALTTDGTCEHCGGPN